VWDEYFLYAPEAEWADAASEPIADGGTIEARAGELIRHADEVLGSS
jgi:hypothetical protein